MRASIAPVISIFALAVITAGCAGGGGQGATSVASIGSDGGSGLDSGGADGTAGDGGGLCLLHNCDSDADCAGCTEDRNSCYAPDKRCVACDPDSGTGCPDGKQCTEFGYCVDVGAVCPIDDQGNQTSACNDDPDCAACDALHQICEAGECVACRGDATENCQGTEYCLDNTCTPKCPESCEGDDDCSQCGVDTTAPAQACFHHRCAQCSDTHPCPGGQQCTPEGTCAPRCGLPGPTPGICDADADCAGCPGDTQNCNAPINGGHGVCGPTANGCSDLGEGVVVLPSPYDQITNLCSNDGDCANIEIDYNVGKLLRDLTGFESIGDAIIPYGMHACADITVGVGDTSISCGVCVPCKQDDDCIDIDVDDVAGDALGPLGAVAAALLLDQLFGPDEHLIHTFCQPVAGDYGVCVPCPTLTGDCAGGGGGGSGTCDHDTCTAGNALDPTCGSCAAAVCAVDSYCCETAWDATCVGEVADNCAGGCDGGGANCHDQCTTGAAMDASCSPCVSQICADDPFCCQSSWDDICVGHVAETCDGQCGGTGCSHSECDQGAPLADGCSDCVTTVCAADAVCCATDWDAICVAEATDMCPGLCTAGGCAHDECQTGAPLDAGCSACATAVCGTDSFCCTTNWDATCVGEAVDAAACSCGA